MPYESRFLVATCPVPDEKAWCIHTQTYVYTSIVCAEYMFVTGATGSAETITQSLHISMQTCSWYLQSEDVYFLRIPEFLSSRL